MRQFSLHLLHSIIKLNIFKLSAGIMKFLDFDCQFFIFLCQQIDYFHDFLIILF